MPVNLGTTELIIILVIVILLFGAGRISRVAQELGHGVREFRGAMNDETMDSGATASPQESQM